MTLPLSHTCIKDTDPNRSVIYLDLKVSWLSHRLFIVLSRFRWPSVGLESNVSRSLTLWGMIAYGLSMNFWNLWAAKKGLAQGTEKSLNCRKNVLVSTSYSYCIRVHQANSGRFETGLRDEALRIDSDLWNASVGNGEADLQIMKGIHVISYRDRILRSYIIPK